MNERIICLFTFAYGIGVGLTQQQVLVIYVLEYRSFLATYTILSIWNPSNIRRVWFRSSKLSDLNEKKNWRP